MKANSIDDGDKIKIKITSILGLKERIEKKDSERKRMRGNYASDIYLLYIFMDCIYERRPHCKNDHKSSNLP